MTAFVEVVTRPDIVAYVVSVLIIGGVIVGIFDFITRRLVLRQRRVLFTIMPRRGRVIEHAHKDGR